MTCCQALLAHNAVLDACEAAAAAKGKPRTFEFWELALPLIPGTKVVRGKELQSPISPIVCAHPPQPDVAYLRSLLAPAVVREVVAGSLAPNHQLGRAARQYGRGRDDARVGALRTITGTSVREHQLGVRS